MLGRPVPLPRSPARFQVTPASQTVVQGFAQASSGHACHATRLWWCAVLLILGLLNGCATTQKPVLYPNSHFNTVGRQQADRDIDDCIRLARTHGAEANKQREVAKKTATGAAVGGASAGAWGLVYGDAGDRALAGAAAGAAGGLVVGSIQASEPDALLKGFVQRCLGDRGYDVIGWN